MDCLATKMLEAKIQSTFVPVSGFNVFLHCIENGVATTLPTTAKKVQKYSKPLNVSSCLQNYEHLFCVT